MWTKLPAALKWITAVYLRTLDDTFHQLNTKHDKELLRNNSLVSICRNRKRRENRVPHQSTCPETLRETPSVSVQFHFLCFILPPREKVVCCESLRIVQFPSPRSMSNHKSSDGPQWAPVVQVTQIHGDASANYSVPRAATRESSGRTTVGTALHKSGLCGRVARWRETAAGSLQKKKAKKKKRQ